MMFIDFGKYQKNIDVLLKDKKFKSFSFGEQFNEILNEWERCKIINKKKDESKHNNS